VGDFRIDLCTTIDWPLQFSLLPGPEAVISEISPSFFGLSSHYSLQSSTPIQSVNRIPFSSGQSSLLWRRLARSTVDVVLVTRVTSLLRAVRVLTLYVVRTVAHIILTFELTRERRARTIWPFLPWRRQCDAEHCDDEKRESQMSRHCHSDVETDHTLLVDIKSALMTIFVSYRYYSSSVLIDWRISCNYYLQTSSLLLWLLQ